MKFGYATRRMPQLRYPTDRQAIFARIVVLTELLPVSDAMPKLPPVQSHDIIDRVNAMGQRDKRWKTAAWR